MLSSSPRSKLLVSAVLTDMSKRKSFLPPPNQPSIKMFITGGATGWKVGCSPLVGGQGCSDKFENDVHSRYMDAGIFQNFSNQPAALAYLNGQFIMRKEHTKKIEHMKRALKNFGNINLF